MTEATLEALEAEKSKDRPNRLAYFMEQNQPLHCTLWR